MADQYSLPDAPLEQVSGEQKIEQTLAAVSGVIKAAFRPLPTQTGDGNYIEAPKETGVFHDILMTRPEDVKTLLEAKMHEMSGDPVDDKTYLMERIIQVDNPITHEVSFPANSRSIVQQQTPVELEEREKFV